MTDLALVTLVQLFCMNFVYIFFKAVQQRNVVKSNVLMLWVCGFFLAYGEAYVIDTVADIGAGLVTATALWLGGSIGTTVAVKSYDRWMGRVLHHS